MKLIEIKNTNRGEIAYLFDEQQNRVYKVFVEDLTQDRSSRKRDIEDEELEYDDAPSSRHKSIIPFKVSIKPSVEVVDDQKTELPPRRQPVPLKRNIMPPGIAGVFTPAGQPGEAIEQRTV